MLQNIQTMLSEEDIIELDKLVDYGIFPNRDNAIDLSIKILTKREIIKKEDLIKGMAVVNGFLMDNIGDLPFADTPIVEFYNGKKIYKFPIRTKTDWNKTILLGFISIDSESLNTIPEISDSAEKLKKVCDRISKELYAKGTLS